MQEPPCSDLPDQPLQGSSSKEACDVAHPVALCEQHRIYSDEVAASSGTDTHVTIAHERNDGGSHAYLLTAHVLASHFLAAQTRIPSSDGGDGRA